jgi:hypothetical protein
VLEERDGAREVAVRGVDRAQAEVRQEGVRVLGDRLLQERLGTLEVALLVEDDAREDEGLEMLRLDLEDLLEEGERLVGLTLPVARDLAASGIRLNTVAPGLVDTPIYDFVPEPEAFKEQLGQSVLFPKRLGTPDELAGMVLACLTNTYMNGETIRVDGGIRMPPK